MSHLSDGDMRHPSSFFMYKQWLWMVCNEGGGDEPSYRIHWTLYLVNDVALAGRQEIPLSNWGYLWGVCLIWMIYLPTMCHLDISFIFEKGRYIYEAFVPDNKGYGTHLGPTGPRWALCWPHELCYLGSNAIKICVMCQNGTHVQCQLIQIGCDINKLHSLFMLCWFFTEKNSSTWDPFY